MYYKAVDMDNTIGDAVGATTFGTGAFITAADWMGWLQNINTGVEYIDDHTGFFSIVLMGIGLYFQYRFKKKSFKDDE